MTSIQRPIMLGRQGLSALEGYAPPGVTQTELASAADSSARDRPYSHRSRQKQRSVSSSSGGKGRTTLTVADAVKSLTFDPYSRPSVPTDPRSALYAATAHAAQGVVYPDSGDIGAQGWVREPIEIGYGSAKIVLYYWWYQWAKSQSTQGIPETHKISIKEWSGRTFKDYKRREDGFFVPGLVFAIPWNPDAKDLATTEVRYTSKDSSRWYEQIFVVVSSSVGKYFAALPVTTYNGQGLAELHPSRLKEHGILYSRGRRPHINSEETRLLERWSLRLQGICVLAKDPDRPLDPMTRVDFGTDFSIATDVPVRQVGKIDASSVADFDTHLQRVREMKATSGIATTYQYPRQYDEGSQNTVPTPRPTGQQPIAYPKTADRSRNERQDDTGSRSQRAEYQANDGNAKDGSHVVSFAEMQRALDDIRDRAARNGYTVPNALSADQCKVLAHNPSERKRYFDALNARWKTERAHQDNLQKETDDDDSSENDNDDDDSDEERDD